MEIPIFLLQSSNNRWLLTKASGGGLGTGRGCGRGGAQGR